MNVQICVDDLLGSDSEVAVSAIEDAPVPFSTYTGTLTVSPNLAVAKAFLAYAFQLVPLTLVVRRYSQDENAESPRKVWILRRSRTNTS